jgi:energy-coupling factor transport system permease protein
LVEESRRILNAQASRGVDFSNGTTFDKFKAFSSLIIPMFVIAFNKSNDLAIAMDARNFFPQGETTKYRNYHFQKSDFVYLASISITFGMIIMLINQRIIFNSFAASDIHLLFGAS